MKFKLVVGTHMEGERYYSAKNKDIVETDKNLATMFPGKFELASENEPVLMEAENEKPSKKKSKKPPIAIVDEFESENDTENDEEDVEEESLPSEKADEEDDIPSPKKKGSRKKGS